MTSLKKIMLYAATAALFNCGGKTTSQSAENLVNAKAPVEISEFGPLEVGADYKSYTKVNTESFPSPTHGKRFVDVYVNDIGLAAYLNDEAQMPTGTVVVKTSKETQDGKATDVDGPIFVMEKREEGFDSKSNDWWYALHWEDVPESWQAKVGGEKVYWKTPEKKVGYCISCHANYDRELGGVPAELLIRP